MDISVIKALCRELSATLPGLRLSDLKEGGTGEIYLIFRGKGSVQTLLVNPRPAMPRLHLVTKKPAGYRDLTPFGQSLRNLLVGSMLISVTQEGLERTVQLHFTRKKRGPEETTTLVLELAGKKPNLITLDADGKIIIAQSFVPLSEETLRPLLPGLAYQPPPRPQKLDPHSVTASDIADILSRHAALLPEKALFMELGGISPLLAAEVIAMSGTPLDAGTVHACLNALLAKIDGGPPVPCIYDTPAGPVLSAFHLARYEGFDRTDFGTMNEAAEAFYGSLLERNEFIAVKASFLKEKRAKLAAARKKLEAIGSDIARADKADTYQLYGNTLMASLKDISEGAASASLTDYTTGERIDVPLDPKLGAVKNAEAYYRKAKKARAGLDVLKVRLQATQEEIKTLEALLVRIADFDTIEQLSTLEAAPSPKSTHLKTSRNLKVELPEFPGFVSSDGYEVLYAKNARGNDALTFKLAQPMDLWMHAQGYHGAHVIVRNPERRPDIPLATILEAAEAAAYHSGAKKDSVVAVDYTFKKYVRKPKDPAPGQAIFTGNKTVFVEPKKR